MGDTNAGSTVEDSTGLKNLEGIGRFRQVITIAEGILPYPH